MGLQQGLVCPCPCSLVVGQLLHLHLLLLHVGLLLAGSRERQLQSVVSLQRKKRY
jgi:hypothetical protein